MALSISKGGLKLPPDVFQLTDELARRRGVAPEKALRDALTAALADAPAQDAEADADDEAATLALVRTIVAKAAKTRKAPGMSEDEILGYPEMFPNLYSRP